MLVLALLVSLVVLVHLHHQPHRDHEAHEAPRGAERAGMAPLVRLGHRAPVRVYRPSLCRLKARWVGFG